MKINSDFKDYYDGCQGFGTDDIVYMRYISDSVIKDSKLTFKVYIEHDVECEITYIGFCSKVYPVVRFWYRPKGSTFKISGGFFYNLESIDKFVKTLDANIQRDYKNDSITRRYGSRSSLKKIFDTVIPNAYSEEPVFIIDSYEDYIDNKYVTKTRLNINSKLDSYNFGKLFPPNLAYQEIHSFLNNKAIPIKPLPRLDDKTMAEIKGFDKWSFRKEPSNKKVKNV